METAVSSGDAGQGGPPLDPVGTGTDDRQKAADANNTVIRFPQNGEVDHPKGPAPEATPPVWAGYAQADSPLAESLEQLALADRSFNPREFIEGAKAAYEMIIESFAKGEKSTLKNLLSREVFDGFSRAIDERERAGQKVEQRFVGIARATIETTSLAGGKAAITVAFVSELISATYGKNGEVVNEGSWQDQGSHRRMDFRT